MDERDREIRNRTYQLFVELGRAPTPDEVGPGTQERPSTQEAWQRLHDAHALVLDEAGAIRMANPFSAVPTPYRVHACGRVWYANCAWDAATAMQVGKAIESAAIAWYEEPLAPTDLEGYREVRRAVRIPISGGEGLAGLYPFRDLIQTRSVDIVQPDVMYMGGISRTLRVVRMAAAAGLPCTPHSANLSLVTLCTMHLLGAIPNPGKYLELSIEGAGYHPWQQGLFLGDPFAVRDGQVTIPSAPGWGAEINPEWLHSATYRRSSLPR